MTQEIKKRKEIDSYAVLLSWVLSAVWCTHEITEFVLSDWFCVFFVGKSIWYVSILLLDCDLVALLEDDTGMELLVCNKIISLELPVKDVHRKIWCAEHNEVFLLY